MSLNQNSAMKNQYTQSQIPKKKSEDQSSKLCNIIGNAHDLINDTSGGADKVVQQDPATDLTFGSDFKSRKIISVEQFKKLCGNKDRLYDVMTF